MSEKNINMIEKENKEYSTVIINNPKNEKFREKLKNTVPIIIIIIIIIIEKSNKKRKDFEEAVKKFKNNENYEFNNILIKRHFLFKAIQEINEELTKNKGGFLIDFSTKLHKFFDDQTLFHRRMKGYINEDEVLGINLVDKDFYYLDLVIKEHTKDKEFIPYVKKLKTDLPVIYVDAC